MSRRVLLWRHGRTAWNADGRFQGQLDPPLDEVGREQAAQAAQVLAALNPAAVVTSDLVRARETAAHLGLAASLDVKPDARLREINLGDWQGLRRAEVEERFPEEYASWLRGEDTLRGGGASGAETYAQVAARATDCVVEELTSVPDDGLLVVVVHGGTARAIVGGLLELDPASWWRFAPLGNCCWSMLVATERGWRMAEHGVAVQEHGQVEASPDVEPAPHGW